MEATSPWAAGGERIRPAFAPAHLFSLQPIGKKEGVKKGKHVGQPREAAIEMAWGVKESIDVV